MRYLVVLLAISASGALAQTNNTVQLGVTYNAFSDPIWRKSSGSQELKLGQSANVIGVRGGWQATGRKWGFGAEASGFSASFSDFRVPHNVEMSAPPGMSSDTGTTAYSSPSYVIGQFDMSAHWLPAAGKPASIYGIFGMGFRKQSY